VEVDSIAMAVAIKDVSVLERYDNGDRLTRVTLTNDTSADFVVSSSGSTETWTSATDGSEVATFDPNRGTLADERALAQALVDWLVDTAREILVDSGVPGAENIPPERLGPELDLLATDEKQTDSVRQTCLTSTCTKSAIATPSPTVTVNFWLVSGPSISVICSGPTWLCG